MSGEHRDTKDFQHSARDVGESLRKLIREVEAANLPKHHLRRFIQSVVAVVGEPIFRLIIENGNGGEREIFSVAELGKVVYVPHRRKKEEAIERPPAKEVCEVQ